MMQADGARWCTVPLHELRLSWMRGGRLYGDCKQQKIASVNSNMTYCVILNEVIGL
jgi:hypothetical protein